MLKYDLNNPLECIYICIYICVCVRLCASVCTLTNAHSPSLSSYIVIGPTNGGHNGKKNASYISVSSHEPEWHIHISVKVYIPNFRWWMCCVTKVSHIATVSSKLVIAHIAGDISLSIFICKLHVAQYNIAYRIRVNVTYIGIISWLYF